MHLQATLTAEDLAVALVHVAPVRLHFTEPGEGSRWIELERPKRAYIVKDEGLLLESSGRLRFSALGMSFEAGVHNIILRISPQVLQVSGKSLAFVLTLEHVDIEYVPSLVERAIVKVVDKALTPKTTLLAWHFADTLSHYFALPDRVEPVEGIALEVDSGELTVGEDHVTFTVHFQTPTISRSRARPSLPEDAVSEVAVKAGASRPN